MANKHKDRVLSGFRTIDDHQFDRMGEHFAADVDVQMNGQAFPGLAAFREMCVGWYAAFPDLQHHVVDYVEDGDRAAFTVRVTGTHTATMRTPNGDIPATGKRVELRAVDSVRFGADGKAIAWHVYMDNVALLEQLGLA